MSTTTRRLITLEVSEGRKANCFRKLNTKGLESLDAAELAVVEAYDLGRLAVAPDTYRINGLAVGAHFQRSCDPLELAQERAREARRAKSA